MANYFLDLSDKRLREVKVMLEKQGYKIFDFEEKLGEILNTDICVVSPAYRWKRDILGTLKEGTAVFGGAVPQELSKEKERVNYTNVMEEERFVVKNAKLTAEAFLVDFIMHTDKSLFEQRILILGNGRVAKAVWQVLRDLHISFDCAMRDEKERFMSELLAEKSFDIKEIKSFLKNYDSVVNTIPFPLFENDDEFKKGAVVFELASRNCLKEATHTKYILCPSLPAKYMPVSAGKEIFKFLVRSE